MREQRLKKWNREWKIQLIEKLNPQWNDLFGYLPKKLKSIEVLYLLFQSTKPL